MMSKLLKAASGEAQQAVQGSIVPDAPERQSPSLAVPNAYGRRSALAAEAAARWEALEREAEELRQALHTAEASIAVLSQTSEALKTEIASLRFENERLNHENAAIQTRIDIAAETLLAIRSVVNRPQSGEAARAAERAVEHALSVEQSPDNAQTEIVPKVEDEMEFASPADKLRPNDRHGMVQKGDWK